MNNIRNHRLAKVLLAGLVILTAAFGAKAVSTTLVIAEVYGGGGNGGSTYKNDFIAIFNHGSTAVDVNGWSVQYASAAGTSWQVTPLAATSTIIAPGAYFLVQEAVGAGGTVDLPTPDAIGTIAMGAGGGKVALVNTITPLTGAVPGGTGATIVDFVGFGTATAYEGSGPTPAPSASVSAQRANGGCLDSDNNATDFATGAPNPRNSASPTQSCGSVTPPVISGIAPASATINAGTTASFTVTLSEGDAPLTCYWFKSVGLTTNLLSETSPTLTLANAVFTNAADYFVIVSNASMLTATSAVVTLSVIDPAINFQPVSQLNLEGSISGFSVNAAGSSLQYQWYRGTPPSGTPQSDDGRIAGAQTRFLTISNTAASDADSYYVVVTGTYGSITSDPATLTTTSGSGALVTWDFNALGLNPANTEPSQGQATARATTVGTTNSFQPAGGNGSPNDPYNAIFGVTNYYLGTASYPNQTTSNKQVGVQYSVSTLGFKNLTVTYDQRASSTGSKYTRLQFTTNGTDYIDYPASSSFANTPSGASSWEPRSFSLAGFPGVRNNPNFGLRVVSEFESTATQGAVANANYVAINGNTATYGGSGTLSYDLVKVTADPISGGNTPPTISAIANQSTPNNAAKVVNFTVGDAETAVGSLTVTAISYNQTLVGDGSIVPGGSGSSRSLTITPNGVDGVAPILVTVTDGAGDSTATWFYLTMTPLNSAPFITQLPYTNTLANTPLSIPFVIGDDSPVGGLTLATSSLNTDLIPFVNIAITGSGSNRVLTLTPAANTLGAAPLLVSVSDGVNTTTTAFTLIVRPSTNVILNDYFGYADGDLTNVSSYFWSDHSGATTITVAGGSAVIDGTKSQDCNALLIGAPYATNSGVTLYSSFKVNFSALPSGAGTYFGHFKDNTTFGFYGRVVAATNGASADGKFRLSIGNASNASATSGQFPRDLDLDTPYTVVTRVTLSNGFSTIWINPTSESDTHTTDTTANTNALGTYSYALRQSTGEGTLAFDDLVVGKSFAAVVPILNIDKSGADPVITWDNPTLPLQAAPIVTGTYTNIPSASSPYSDTSGAAQRYFRLYKP